MNAIPKRRHRNSGRTEKVRLQSHRQWVAGHECLVAKHGGCWGKVRAAHFDGGRGHHVPLHSKGGMSMKNGDNLTAPLCDGHHGELHGPNMGTIRFEAKYGVDLLETAETLWRRSPHGKRYRMEHGQ